MTVKKKAIKIIAAAQLLAGCGRPQTIQPADVNVAEGRELLCLAENQQEAERIAEQYDIELVSFRDGVAVFHTEEDPVKVINYGISQNYTQLSLNTTDTEIK